MKKRRRSKSRKSAGPASPSRWGGSASSNRSGETAASSDRSGGRASSASADLDREGGDERTEHWRSQGGDSSPSPGNKRRPDNKWKHPYRYDEVTGCWLYDEFTGRWVPDGSLAEGTACTPKLFERRGVSEGDPAYRSEKNLYMWIPKRLLLKFKGNVGAAVKAYIEEEGNAPAALKETEEENIKQNDDATMKKDCLDAELLMDQSVLHSSHSCSGSGDATEEVPFDGDETSLILMMDKEPKRSCFGDRGKIAQDEDEGGHSGKKTPAVEDEQYSDKIGQEHKQEQGSARGYVQALLNMDDETIAEKTRYFSKGLNFDSPERCDYHEYEPEELTELYEELALYRIRAYELTVDSKSVALNDADLKLKYPRSILRANLFFRSYEENLEWSFDPELCKNNCFDNYQRLVLKDSANLNSEFYLSFLYTYEQDLAYVQYMEEVANKTKWIEDYLGDTTFQERIEGVAFMQALDIAAGFPNVPQFLVSFGFKEYMHSVWKDYSYKGLDGLFFEIWKRVAKGKMSFKEALLEIHNKDMFPLRSSEIKHELENTPHRLFPLEDFYGSHVAGIDKMASDDKACQLIREAVAKKVKPKYYLDYARKKLAIAKDIYLIPEGMR
ncbi:unnamed protein product [Urochloa humidicola]